MQIPENQTVSLADALHERASTRFDFTVDGKAKPGNTVTIKTRLLSENSSGLKNKSITARSSEYGLTENLTTDETGSAKFNLTLTGKSPSITFTYAGDSSHMAVEETKMINISSISSPLLNMHFLLLPLSLIFLLMVFARFMEQKPFSLGGILGDMWRALK